VSIVLLFKNHQQACSSCSVFTDFAACSTPPPPHSRHASTLTHSLDRWAAARVCFPPRCCQPGIKGIPRDVKLPYGRRLQQLTASLSALLSGIIAASALPTNLYSMMPNCYAAANLCFCSDLNLGECRSFS